MSKPHAALAELATHYWKLCEALSLKHGEDEGGSDAAMLRYSRGRLDAVLAKEDMELRRFDGQPWNASLPTIPINSDDVSGDHVHVSRTIEPTILHGGEVLVAGQVMLANTPASEE